MTNQEIRSKIDSVVEQIKDLAEIAHMVEGDDIGDLTRQWISDKQFELDEKIKEYNKQLNETVRYSRFEDSDTRGCARHSMFQDDMGEE